MTDKVTDMMRERKRETTKSDSLWYTTQRNQI